MDIHNKRTSKDSIDQVQRGSLSWWTHHPMSYDWEQSNSAARFSPEWFDELDRRELYAHRLFSTDETHYDRLMPFDRIKGKKVLEIGCGMGLHSETLAKNGADLYAVDLTPTAIQATTKRLEIKGLSGEIQQADAETLPFPDDSFDFVWSWGVIHHSSRTARIVREIARVLKPDGEVRVMVYNRVGMPATLAVIQKHILAGGFLYRSIEDSLYAGTDGFSARYYTQDQFEDLFLAFFDKVASEICGQEADAVPLPRHIRKFVLPAVPIHWLKAWQKRRGGFIFLTATGLR